VDNLTAHVVYFMLLELAMVQVLLLTYQLGFDYWINLAREIWTTPMAYSTQLSKSGLKMDMICQTDWGLSKFSGR
jgi:hypothetical protein